MRSALHLGRAGRRGALVLCAWVSMLPFSLAMSSAATPDAIVIMMSEGDYLEILPDGSARAGFGVLPACAEVPGGTFDYQQLLRSDLSEARVIANERRTSDGGYISVGYRRGSTAFMYQFDGKPLIHELFGRAAQHARITRHDVFCPFAGR